MFNYTILKDDNIDVIFHMIFPFLCCCCGLLSVEFVKTYLLMRAEIKRDEEDEELENKYREKKEEDESETYKIKYFDDYDKLEDKELTEDFVKDLNLNPVIEKTPKGEILMYYDYCSESFIYYCKSKDIPYAYLETVSRKYVVTYDCKSLYIDIRKEIEKGINRVKEVIAKKEDENLKKIEEERKKNSIYASFKSYNRKSQVNAEQKDKIYVLKEKCNRFSYKGKFEDYNENNLHENNDNNEESQSLKMSYSEFKKKQL